jgi:hypothetical protein
MVEYQGGRCPNGPDEWSEWGADEGAPPCLKIFIQNSKLAQSYGFETDTFHYSKNTQTLYDARFLYSEQFSQLGRFQIPNSIHAINLRTYSNFNLP